MWFTSLNILLQNILITNPITSLDPVCTARKEKMSWCEWQRKKHFPITVQSLLPPLICLTGHSMDFFLRFKWVFVLSAVLEWPPCTFPTTSWLSTKKQIHGMQLRNHSLFPSSAPCSGSLTAGITIHYVSAGKGCEKLWPYFTIEACQWNNQRAWRAARDSVPQLQRSCVKQETLLLVSGHV